MYPVRTRRILPPAPDRLTPHFRLAEFACRDGTPVPASAQDAVRALCELYLEPLRRRFGVCTVVSGYRHRRYNDAVGGVGRSMHVYDEHPLEVAADVRFARGTPSDWAAAADRLGVAGLGRYESWIHVDTRRSGRARWTG